MENLFDALAAALLVPDNQQRFRQGVVGLLFLFFWRAWCLMLMHGVVRHVIIYIDALHEDLAIFESPMALIGAACLCRRCVEWGRYEGDTRLKLLFVCRS